MPTLPHMNDDQKMKAIAMIWSNANKLAMARYIYSNSPCSPIQIINNTNLISPLVSRTIKEMCDAGVLERSEYKEPDQRQVFYRLTDLGKKVLTIFD